MALEPPLQYPKARGADITPSLIKVDWDQHPVPFGSQALFPVRVRKTVQWAQPSTFFSHLRQPSELFIYSSSVGQPLKKINLCWLANQPPATDCKTAWCNWLPPGFLSLKPP